MREDIRGKLELKFGGRDLVETLDEIRSRVITGEIEGILVIEIGERNGKAGFGRSFAWKDDMDFHWSRYTAAVGSVYHELQNDGLTDD